jgi:hypothetical protein
MGANLSLDLWSPETLRSLLGPLYALVFIRALQAALSLLLEPEYLWYQSLVQRIVVFRFSVSISFTRFMTLECRALERYAGWSVFQCHIRWELQLYLCECYLDFLLFASYRPRVTKIRAQRTIFFYYSCLSASQEIFLHKVCRHLRTLYQISSMKIRSATVHILLQKNIPIWNSFSLVEIKNDSRIKVTVIVTIFVTPRYIWYQSHHL